MILLESMTFTLYTRTKVRHQEFRFCDLINICNSTLHLTPSHRKTMKDILVLMNGDIRARAHVEAQL